MSQTSIFVTLFLMLFFINSSAQTPSEKFYDALSNSDTLAQWQAIKAWEKLDSNDAELYVAKINYYFNKSRIEMIALGNNPKGEEALQITDSISQEPVGYLYEEVFYDYAFLQEALDCAEEAIKIYPNRLDLRFGEIFIYGDINDYEKFTTRITEAVAYSVKNNNSWVGARNEPTEDAENFFLSTIQGYQIQLFNAQTECDTCDYFSYVMNIAETILAHYPEHVESLSNISICYIYQEKYNQALEYLLKAEQVNEKDCVILGNITHAYMQQNDYKSAIKYLKKMIKYGTEAEREYAKNVIAEIKNM